MQSRSTKWDGVPALFLIGERGIIMRAYTQEERIRGMMERPIPKKEDWDCTLGDDKERERCMGWSASVTRGKRRKW